MIYHKCAWHWENRDLHLFFHFELEGINSFEHRIILHTSQIPWTVRQNIDLEPLVFHIGLIELLSYWKCACPPVIRLEGKSLTPSQQAWWNKLFYKGLGEFRFLNQISAKEEKFISFEQGNSSSEPQAIAWNTEKKYLIPIGGGKDSVVTLNALRHLPACGLLIVTNKNANKAAEDCAIETRIPLLKIERIFDSQLFTLIKQGYWNGHVPFSASVAFISLLTAAITGSRYLPLSNESSANEPTVHGTDINHQYSKSVEFEQAFREYTQQYLATDIEYFSLLRPLSELQIAEKFSRLMPFHSIFRSCNIAGRDNRWCGHCPKCLFSYILLSPFLSREALCQIFQGHLLQCETLRQALDELIGATEHKPFECVGTQEEVLACLSVITVKKEFAEDALVIHLKNQYSHLLNQNSFLPLLKASLGQHHIPADVLAQIPEFLAVS